MPFSMTIRELQDLLSKYRKAASSYGLADLDDNHVRKRVYVVECVDLAASQSAALRNASDKMPDRITRHS
jgi:hypothetical protein